MKVLVAENNPANMIEHRHPIPAQRRVLFPHRQPLGHPVRNAIAGRRERHRVRELMPQHFRMGIGGDTEMTGIALERLSAALDELR